MSTVNLLERMENIPSSEIPAGPRIALTSTSQIKYDAIKPFLSDNIRVSTIKVPTRVEQPINGFGRQCARERVDWVLKNHPNEFDLIVSIENYINTVECEDQAIVIIYLVGQQMEYIAYSQPVSIPDQHLLETVLKEYRIDGGASKTFGEAYHELYPEIPGNNWMKITANMDRTDLLRNTVKVVAAQLRQDLLVLGRIRQSFIYYDDFPKPGVKFMDWSGIFLDYQLTNDLIRIIGKKYQRSFTKWRIDTDVKYIFGLDSRGCWIGTLLAQYLKCGFVPIRKAGKIPPPKVTRSYAKEYGEDTLELTSSLPRGPVVILDDVLATGGSLKAAIELAEAAGHTVVDVIAIRDVPGLREMAAEKLKGYPLRVLIQDRVK